MSRIMLAYLASWQQCDISALPVEKLTHLCYAFAKVVDGEVIEQDAGDPLLSNAAYCQKICAQLQQLKLRNPALKILISIGGWGADGFSDAALTETSREQFSRSTLRFMQKYQFDGVDLDWEYPSNAMAGIKARPEDRQNFTLMLSALRIHLDDASAQMERSSPYLLTIAAGVGTYYLEGVELEKVAAKCDFINLMTYDFYNGWATRAGHHANLLTAAHDPSGDSADRGVQLFLDHGVAAEKMVLGCPFYGRSLLGVASPGLGAEGRAQSNGTHSYYKIANELIPSGHFTRHWDESAQVPWLYDGDEFISYEDAESIALKGQYVKQHGLAGAMFWEYTEDQSNVLLDVLWQNLQD
ncbi:glycoside hydrolase family 18 protein [Deefgea sp. CFH1-16]|uniref:glycoside hydrolase family 18 protein n=1 Tax=Deefgea sp. CFH1-16 TaxID=2675457 RepID=UPI0015F38866|nr:glycoside hydrolase family 18 protein [Deefgea sp. CFH1-16]MBM5574639.1 chitinase [Deefgea sp. CFH1-16]